MPDTVQLIDPGGRPRDVPFDEVAAVLSQPGWRAPTQADTSRLTQEAADEQDFGGIGGAARAIFDAGLSGGTVGISDIVRRIGGESERDLAGPRKQFPTLSTVAEVGGNLLPALAAPGSLLARTGSLPGAILGATPAGRLAGVGREILAASEGAGLAGRVGAAATAAAIEGGVASGGQYLSQVALGDKPLAAEGFLGAMGKGALWAAPIGGSLALGERGLQRAKSLFPKSEVTREAARAVDREATDALTRVVSDGDQMLELAKQRIRQVDARAGASASTERATRAMFGVADPATIENQVAQHVDKAKLTEAVDEYARARSQFDDWVRTEADEDLEAALLRVRAPSVQVGGPSLRVAEFGEVVPPQAGEFAEVGRTSVGKRAAGTPGPHIPPRVPITSQLPPLPLAGDSTTAFKIEDIGLKFDPKTRTYHDPSVIPAPLPLDDTSELRRAMGAADTQLAPGGAAPLVRDDEIRKALDTLRGAKKEAPAAVEPATPQRIEVKRVGRPSERKLEIPGVEGPVSRPEVDKWVEKQLPKGWSSSGLETHRDFSLEYALPATHADVAENAIYIVKPSDVAKRGIMGNELHPDHLKSLMGPRRGDLDPLAIKATPDGRLWIEDGNHRLQVAATKDEPVVIRIQKVGDGWKPQSGARDVSERIGGELPSRDVDDLTTALRGTKSALDSGADIVSIGSASRAKYAASKAAARETDTAKFHARATDNYASSAMAADEAAMQAGARGVAESAARREAARIAQQALQPAVKKADAIQAALRKHVGKDIDVGADLGRAAQAIGDVEGAMARLVDALGPDAPASAAAAAKGYRAATATQIETLGSAAAKTADDLARKVVPLIEAQRTVVDSDVMQALRKHDSAQAARTARQAAKPTPTPTPEPATRRRGVLGAAADVGTAIEVLNAMGVRTPDISAIPVIGPALSLYLKARAVLGIIGRKGGSVGRSTESVVAAKSAQIRDRINAATRQALDVTAKGAKRAIPVAGPAGALAHRLFPGDGDVKSKDPEVLYRARMDELVRAQQPGAIEDAVADRVRSGDPDLQDAIVAQTRRAAEFLYSKAPKEGLMQSMVPTDGKWHPSRSRLQEWSRYVAAVHDPAGVLEDLANGHVTMEAAEALRVVYPGLYAEAQRTLLEHAPQMQKTLPYSRRVSLSIMFRVPVDLTMTRQHLQFLQPPPEQTVMPAGPQPGAPPAPALTAPLQIGQQTMTSLERRSGV